MPVELNIVERAVAAVAPEWAGRRLAMKVALREAIAIAKVYNPEIEARRFDSARRDRRAENWNPTGGSGAAEIAAGLGITIRRSRDLCRNNEWGRNAKRKWVSHLIGTGIVPRPVGADGAKKTAREAWNAFGENCDPEALTDIYGKQAKVAGEVFEGGAAFVRWYLRGPEMGLKVPLQCEVLEHDFLDINRTEVAGQNIVINGVEYNGRGQRVAYWLFPEHPGDVALVRKAGFRSQRVPASEVDHVFDPLESNSAVTGMPWLAVAALRLRDMGDRDEAALLREKIAACFAVFVRRQGATPAGVAQAADRSTKSDGTKVETIRPGMIGYIESDGDITVANPPQAGDVEFNDRNLYAVAAGIGLTHSQLSGNLKNVNFTSLREGKLDFWPSLDQKQWFMMAPMMCVPSWRRVMKAAHARGLAVSPDMTAKWSMPKRPWVNPVDDMRGEAAELGMLLEPWDDKVAARGWDPDEFIENAKKWRDKLVDAGFDPTVAAAIAGGRPAPTQQQDPNAPAKPGQE